MTNQNNDSITVRQTINGPIEIVWRMWTEPKHIMNWNFASDDWYSPKAVNDFKVGGRFCYTMSAKDGSFSFEFSGTYTSIKEHEFIAYTLDDDRKVSIKFVGNDKNVELTEIFEPETENSIELQENGWLAILSNFKKYTEEMQRIETLHYEIIIDAKVDVVYNKMIADETYRMWTSIFNETSHFRGTWKKGSKILFVGFDADGNEGGMVSRIKENMPNEFISIEHLGEYVNGEEMVNKTWSGSLENYTFKEHNGKTLLSIDIDSNQEFKSYFDGTWPLALQKLQEICEEK